MTYDDGKRVYVASKSLDDAMRQLRWIIYIDIFLKAVVVFFFVVLFLWADRNNIVSQVLDALKIYREVSGVG